MRVTSLGGSRQAKVLDPPTKSGQDLRPRKRDNGAYLKSVGSPRRFRGVAVMRAPTKLYDSGAALQPEVRNRVRREIVRTSGPRHLILFERQIDLVELAVDDRAAFAVEVIAGKVTGGRPLRRLGAVAAGS